MYELINNENLNDKKSEKISVKVTIRQKLTSIVQCQNVILLHHFCYLLQNMNKCIYPSTNSNKYEDSNCVLNKTFMIILKYKNNDFSIRVKLKFQEILVKLYLKNCVLYGTEYILKGDISYNTLIFLKIGFNRSYATMNVKEGTRLFNNNMNLNCICSKLFVFDEERICFYPVLTYLKGSSIPPLIIQLCGACSSVGTLLIRRSKSIKSIVNITDRCINKFLTCLIDVKVYYIIKTSASIARYSWSHYCHHLNTRSMSRSSSSVTMKIIDNWSEVRQGVLCWNIKLTVYKLLVWVNK
ncbi:hypothetical protein AGLY_013782 [Aphis glycines]|uniref:Uncharacterized protein n=1 Tax=Aphis glycines TaxID=307491 RepID=A0A6G0T522_APHGL|nr:hypothetical protein AGLY_013782 [Aphis glycines]